MRQWTIFNFLFVLFLLNPVWSQSVQNYPKQPLAQPSSKAIDTKVTYRYRYSSVLLLDKTHLSKEELKNWYRVYHQAVDECMNGFQYPDDFNTPIEPEKQKFQNQCYYTTILKLNDFENDQYFNHKKQEYNIQKTDPDLAKSLSGYLTCPECNLYPNRNSDVILLDSPWVNGKKIRTFTLTEKQQDIFSHIFLLSHDQNRIVQASGDVIAYWGNQMNAAKTRTQLKQIMDHFVDNIVFQPIETAEELQQIGKKLYSRANI